MGKIFYSMSGEGRGHATRVRAMVEALRDRHEIHLFAPGDAHELLEPIYRGSGVRIRKIPCLTFDYDASGSIRNARTVVRGLRWYFRDLGKLVDSLEETFRAERPDLVVSDFEPSLPRAARRHGVPYVSLDHQHFLVVSDLSELPFRRRFQAAVMSWIVRMYCSGQARTIVSSFYFPPLRRAFRGHVLQVGVLMRPEVIAARPSVGEHLVVYLRKFATRGLLDALLHCGREVHVYGLGDRPAEGRLSFRGVRGGDFVSDLASSAAIVTTAGNQLVGEALFLGKPVLGMPETRNFEQSINAYYLRKSGCGDWAPIEDVGGSDLDRFLGRLGELRGAIRTERLNGTPEAVAALEAAISGSRERPGVGDATRRQELVEA